jgi:hypothetical protein
MSEASDGSHHTCSARHDIARDARDARAWIRWTPTDEQAVVFECGCIGIVPPVQIVGTTAKDHGKW